MSESKYLNSIKLTPEQVKARQDAADARRRMTANDMMEEILADRKARLDRLSDEAFDRFVDGLARVFNPTRWFKK